MHQPDAMNMKYNQFVSREDEARMKARNESILKRARTNNPDYYHQEYENRRLMASQQAYMGQNEFRQQMHSTSQMRVPSHEYMMQTQHQPAYQMQNQMSYQKMMQSREYFADRERMKYSNMSTTQMAPEFQNSSSRSIPQHFQPREMMPTQEEMFEKKQFIEGFREDPNLPPISKQQLVSLFIDQMNKLPQGKRMSKDRKNLYNMRRAYIIKKLKFHYTCLKNIFKKEHELFEMNNIKSTLEEPILESKLSPANEMSKDFDMKPQIIQEHASLSYATQLVRL